VYTNVAGELTTMADKKIKSKTYLFLGLIFMLTVVTVIYIVRHHTNSIVNELTLNRVKTANRSLVNYLSELSDRITMRAEIISGDEAVITAIKNEDYQSLKRYLLNFTFGIDITTICDPQGIVLARSHKDITGDDISGYKAVSEVLNTAATATSIEVLSGNNNSLTVYASAPIYSGGRMIGIINCAYDLTQNAHMDIFKERTGCEASIFQLDERISTTITDETGARVTGLKANDFVSETVLKHKKEYVGDLNLFGKMYGVCYSPLIIDDEPIGMLFTGIDIVPILERQRIMNFLIALASITGIAASLTFMVVSNINARKYAHLSDKQLNQQILMANISRSFLSDANTDTLITNTLRMVGEFMNIPQILLFMVEEDGVTSTCSNEWINPELGLPSLIGASITLQDPMLSIVKNLKPGEKEDSYLTSNNLLIKEAMSPYRIHFNNYITTPIFIKGEMCALIDFSREDDDQKWNESEISLATLFASTLSGVFEREAMARQTSVVENSPLMIFYTDSDGKMVYANPAASALTGYTLAELKSGGYKLILDEQGIRDVKEIYVPQTLRKGTIQHESNLICKDGSNRILKVTSFVVNSGITAAICMDLTEIRAMEDELIKAKNKAEQANRSKSEFLSNMSHEMRTPMNAIIGMTAIAKNSADNERKNYALHKIENASTHLLGIINDVLDMSKIEANKLELMHEEFELRSLLQKAVTFVQFRMDEKQHKFSLNVDNSVPEFFIGDDQRLTQVVTNLLSNAAKFTPEDGKISVDVSLVEKADEISTLRFEVADTGIGISPEHQKKIFNIFEQAEGGIARKFGGTGLGLSISKRIVELMGGEIHVESELGKGSTFIFTAKLLRCEKDPHFKNVSDDRSKVLAEEIAGKFTGRKVLLAEDIEINREILLSILEGTGLIIDTAENGKEALEKIAAAPDYYDLVFMDMQMPEMDGLEATRRIRTVESTLAATGSPRKRLPIIAMTANVFKDDIDNCLMAGMDDHIGKPLDMETVYEKLRKYL